MMIKFEYLIVSNERNWIFPEMLMKLLVKNFIFVLHNYILILNYLNFLVPPLHISILAVDNCVVIWIEFITKHYVTIDEWKNM